MTTPTADPRRDAARVWAEQACGQSFSQFVPVSADASFRRYFRAHFHDPAASGSSVIVMDAPPETEDTRPFVRIAALLEAAGVHAPKVLAQENERGFLLLSDVGTETYLDVLNEGNATALFADARDALIRWQQTSRADVLPPYDEALLRRELQLFPDWYIARLLGATLNNKQQQLLDDAFSQIVRHNLAEARVFVHRDFMPRNLMVADPNPGVLDFQDAVMGPISYDITSLYRDAFISWEETFVLDGTIRYWEAARAARLPVPAVFDQFYRDCDFMGLQRHLKVLGIFARIRYRDGKPKYLDDAPRFLNYLRQTCARYAALKPLLRLLEDLHGNAPQTGYTF